MHQEAHDFVKSVKQLLPGYFKNRRVLEVGSLDINGSVREFFEGCDYTGIDLGPGPGVDHVIHATDVKDFHLDVVISSEALEHDKLWKETLYAMRHNLNVGGLLIFTCAGPARAEHGTSRSEGWASPYTNTHYRNLSMEDIHNTYDLNGSFYHWQMKYERGENDLQFFGIKRY